MNKETLEKGIKLNNHIQKVEEELNSVKDTIKQMDSVDVSDKLFIVSISKLVSVTLTQAQTEDVLALLERILGQELESSMLQFKEL